MQRGNLSASLCRYRNDIVSIAGRRLRPCSERLNQRDFANMRQYLFESRLADVMASLNGAVGNPSNPNVTNYWKDVYTVQSLLKQAARKTGNADYDPITVDGIIFPFMSRTVSCIKAFQSRFMGAPDGVISPNKKTIAKLSEFESTSKGPASSDPTEEDPTEDEPGTTPLNPSMPVDGYGCCFPMRIVPDSKHWKKPKGYNAYSIYFGAKRYSKKREGWRKHAAVDLIAPFGTPIHAVANGIMRPYFRNFKNGTGAITVTHTNFVVRYGETTSRMFVEPGEPVEQGQQIGEVGNVGKRCMIHFEMYSDTKSNQPLIDKSQKLTPEFSYKKSPFQRRKDIIDPAPYLLMWRSNLP